jgi:hypothetical protein
MSYTPQVYRPPNAPARVAILRRSPRARGAVGFGDYVGGLYRPPFNQGTGLGVLPLAAALPSITSVLSNVGQSIIGIVDPGKKRDAERQARASMYEQLAVQGSSTAANRVYSAAIGIHGGEGPTKEANWYKAAWAHIQQAMPAEFVAKVVASPRVGLPDPQRPELAPADAASIQAEINAYHGIVNQATQAVSAAAAKAGIPGGTTGLLLIAAVGLAFVASRGGRR